MANVIRIYYECLEQVYHYILPLVQKGIEEAGVDSEIELVRRPKSVKEVGRSALSGIYAFTTPDLLITLCWENTEIPLVIGEISEAVLTEDHEMQRANAAVVASLARCLFLKISGKKQSMRPHGGKKDFEPVTVGKSLEKRFGYKGFIYGDWPTKENNPYVLDKNPIYLSTPPFGKLPLIERALVLVVSESLKHFDELLKQTKTVIDLTIPVLEKDPDFVRYIKALTVVDGIEELIEDWQKRKTRSEFPRIYLDEDKLVVTIYRFSHEADPDRGFLCFASFVAPVQIVHARYIVKHGPLGSFNDFIEAFVNQSIGENMPPDLFRRLGQTLKESSASTVDITDFLEETRDAWQNNKVLLTLFMFADGIFVHTKGLSNCIQLNWDREKLFRLKKIELFDSLIELFGFNCYGPPLKIEKVTSELNEDETTYLVIHHILRPNNFEIVAVSYPGAQSDTAILPKVGGGREQERKYIDVIAWLPPVSKYEEDLALEESKRSFSRNEIESIVEELDKFRNDRECVEALATTLKRLGYDRKLKHIVIGVAFGIKPSARTTWEPEKVDFIVRIIGRKRWQLASFGEYLRGAFGLVEGEVTLPEVYKVARKQVNNLTTLEEFMV
jgi:hypothetical protein